MTDVIRDLPIDDRPRERMLRHGAQTLSIAELVALLLGSGVRGKNAIQLARDLLRDGLEGLFRADPATLAKISGIGTAKATRLCAAVEIARRRVAREPEEAPEFDTAVLGRKLITAFEGHTQERLGAAFLDARRRILKQREIFVGTVDHALVSTREIIRYAMTENAISVVLYHNHPTGNPTPSAADEDFTLKLQRSLDLCDVKLLDHLIIGTNRYYSMKEQGYLG